MTSQVIAVRPDVCLEALTTLFLECEIGGAPVVDERGRPIGVVSKTDLLRAQHERGETREWQPLRARSPGGYDVDLGEGFHSEPIGETTVADVMAHIAFTISETAPVAQAAALMAFEGIHRVPVVSAEGRVTGLITTLDILRWMAEQDGYLFSTTPDLLRR